MGAILHNAKLELRAARNALEAMRKAEQAADYLEGWSTFVDRLERVWAKAEQECQPFKNQFNPWQGRFTKLRKDDELLSYLFHARNAAQHTIEFVAGFAAVRLKVQLPPGTAQLIFDKKNGTLTIIGANAVEQNAPTFMLLPFKDRGVTFNPPSEHWGVKQEFDPLQAAEAGLAFYEDFVQQVEAKFFTAPSTASAAEK